MRTDQRLAALRGALRELGLSAVIVPSADPHLSEYLPAHWQGRQWLSGFSGSSGTLVVTDVFAGVWTDSRYFEQAEQELAGSDIQLMRQTPGATAEHVDWLCSNLSHGASVAISGDVQSLGMQELMHSRFAAAGIALRTDVDLLDTIWTDRPPLPANPVREHQAAFVEGSRLQRLDQVRAAMAARGASHHLVSSLDDIAWITGLRGSDVSYNPVFLAHLLISAGQVTLFVAAGKLAPALQQRLADDGIGLADYADVAAALNALPASARLLLDPRRVVQALVARVPAGVAVVHATNPSQRFKACKSAAELAHVRRSMEYDGVALVRFLIWLEQTLATSPLTELDIATRLADLRAAHPDFVGESFATIAGYLANGALPHYRATSASHSRIDAHGLLLVDSGGQYEGGTTDITRTIAVGPTTAEQRHDYTLVLKGMIALSRARFPRGTSGQQLDAIARAPIWAAGINYGHGTGHGVGYFLNVHEGPQAIRPAAPGETGVALEVGMITSNEPGIYRPGRHGVRIENLITTVASGAGEFGEFLAFETLTLCPIDTTPIERALLDPGETQWLNSYHEQVCQRLAPALNPAEHDWLVRRCAPL